MAAPTYQSSGAQQASTGGTVTPLWPTHLANDIGLLVVETSGDSATMATPSGWTAVSGSPVTDVATTAGSKLHLFWKRAASSSESGVATGALTNHIVARISTFRGCVTTGDPINVVATDTKTTASTTATAPSVTTTVGEALVVFVVGRPNDTSSSTSFDVPVNSNLTGLAEATESGTANGNGGGFVVSYGTKDTAGSTGTTTFTKAASTTDTYFTLALTPAQPAVAQSAFRFYEDGTESGSTAIAAQDTNITRTVDTDSNLALRLRLQETADAAGASTDDYRLQYKLNSGGYVDTGQVPSVDGYAEANQNTTFTYGNTSSSASMFGQTFTGSGETLATASFLLAKRAGVTGNIFAKVYAHSGTFGTSGVPTGAALATSDAMDASTLSTTVALVTFAFSGANQISLTASTNYAVVIDCEGTSSTLAIDVGVDNTSPTHPGNFFDDDSGSWNAYSTTDAPFYINRATAAAVVGFDSSSLTDGGATTNRLGAGTGSFVAGEVSEDGLVDDHQLTASNYTEHLYSLTLVASALADNDTLDFRVLRNGAVLNSYTVTPRITVSKSGGGGYTPDINGQFFGFF